MKYFDYAAASPLLPEVLESLQKSLKEDFANPSSKHQLGHNLFENLELFRQDFLKSLKSSTHYFYFTSSATESNNTIIQGFPFKEGDVALFSPADHPSLISPLKALEKKSGIKLRPIKLLPNGAINTEHLKSLLDSTVKFVALTHVNNTSGAINEISELAQIIKQNSLSYLHIDAVQSFGKIPFELLPAIDSLSISSHKIGGPKGIAGLYLSRDHQITPLLLGGGQESGFRASTVAYPLAKAFHTAMELNFTNQEHGIQHTRELKQIFEDRLLKIIPDVSFPFASSSPYICALLIPTLSSDIILRHLEMRGYSISSSAACSSRLSGFNSTLFELGMKESLHKNFLRVSFSSHTKREELEGLIQAFNDTWDDVKHLIRRNPR